MIPELEATLSPLREAVATAEARLDAGNRSTDSPLRLLPLTGNVHRAYRELADRCIDLLNAIGAPTSEGTVLQIQGRIRRLNEQEETQ